MPGIVIDTLMGTQGSGLPSDTLWAGAARFSAVARDTASVADSLGQSVSAAEVFGPQSVLAPAGEAISAGTEFFLLTDNWVFRLLVLLVFIGYCYTIYYFREPVSVLLKIGKSRLYGEKLMEEHGYMFSFFLRTALGVGWLAVSLLSVRCVEMSGSPLLDLLPEWAVPLSAVGIGVAIWLIVGFQRLVLCVAGNLVRDISFTGYLLYLRRLLAVLFVILSVPVMLLLMLNEGPSVDIVLYVLIVECFTFFLFWLYKTREFFLAQNVSILHWFLYLCGVEIFPVSVFVLLALRNS